jgi:hypothetical protein
MAAASLSSAHDAPPKVRGSPIDELPEPSETARRVERLPTEVGVLLLSAGITMGMMPPPPGPFDLSIMLSGGLVLWPRGFRAIDCWVQKRFPGVHQAAMSFLGRFLDDLERRYPESLRCHASFDQTASTNRGRTLGLPDTSSE